MELNSVSWQFLQNQSFLHIKLSYTWPIQIIKSNLQNMIKMNIEYHESPSHSRWKEIHQFF